MLERLLDLRGYFKRIVRLELRGYFQTPCVT